MPSAFLPPRLFTPLRLSVKCAIVGVCLSFLGGCAGFFPSNKIDPAGNLSRADYLSLRHRGHEAKNEDAAEETNPLEATPAAAPPIPTLPPAPVPPRPVLPEKKVSLSVTDSTPLRDVLIELGREGHLNLEIDPRIKGGLFFTAHDQPFEKVLRHLCALAGLRTTNKDGFVRVELDEPYQQTYPLDFLSLARKTTSEITIATNVFDVDVSGANGGGSTVGSSKNGNDNNSVAKIVSTGEADFWSEVEKTLPNVLETASHEKPLVKRGKNDGESKNATFSLDKQGGLVTVFGNSQQQEAVSAYLNRLREKASSQVLIEARIVEVELSDEFQSGVNWAALFNGKQGLAADFGAPGASTALSGASTGLFSASLDTQDFSGILKLVRTFGTTRVLSAPRLTVMNNQTAVLKVARNEVYFLTTAQFPTTVSTSGVAVNGTPVFSSTPRTVPVGLVMTVQPAINREANRVTMTLRPTISRVVDRVNDPSIGLNAANAGVTDPVASQIPVLAVREIDSVLQVQSGEVAVMGGLMQDSSDNQDQGVPPFDTVPYLGNFAKSRSNAGRTSELVILLRATILKNAAPHEADTDLYAHYNNDPRPLPLSTEKQ